MPGRPRRQRLRQRLHRAARRRGARRQPRGARRAGEGRRRGRAHRPRRPRRARRRCRSTTPRSASTPTARRPGSSASPRATRRRRRSRRRSATSTRPSVWIDSDNGQSYYVVTSYDGAARRRHAARSAQLPVRVGDDGQAGHARRLRQRSAARVGPDRRRAQPARSARRTCSCRPRGATSAAPPRDLEAALATRPAHARTSQFDFVGQVELMRTTFSGLGLALGARGHGRVHDHGVAVQVAAAAVRHAVHDPGVARRASCSR